MTWRVLTGTRGFARNRGVIDEPRGTYADRMTVPFVGREAELQAIGALIARARREHSPGSALITGEPGSGKSRLLRESVARPGFTTDRLGGRLRTHRAGFRSQQSATSSGGSRASRIMAGGLTPLCSDRVSPADKGCWRRSRPLIERRRPSGTSLYRSTISSGWTRQSLSLLHYLVRAAEATRSSVVVVAAARPSPAAVTFANGMAGPLPDSRRASIELRGLPLGRWHLAGPGDQRPTRRGCRGGTVAPGRRIPVLA